MGQKQTKRQFLGKNVFHYPFRFYSHQICSHVQTHKLKNGHQTRKSKNAFNHHHHQRFHTATQTLRTQSCSVGEMTFICNICKAAKFQEESKAICCGNGKYNLDPYPNLPAPIKELFNGDSADSEHFLKNIRRYNCAFQMTSFGCKEAQTHGWSPNFKIQG